MITIVDKIKASIHAATDLPVYYDSEEMLNKMLDYGGLPCAYFALLQDGSLERNNGVFRERVNVAIFFVNKTNFEPDAEENEQIIQDCKEAAYRWLAALRIDQFFTLDGSVSTQRVYEQNDVILTGFAVRVSLTEKQGYCNG